MKSNYMIAVDIDDTLVETARHTFELAKKIFDHPLSVDELLFKYGQPDEVPEWQDPKVDRWLEKHLGNVDYLATIPVVADAQIALQKIATARNIACYITSREHFMKQMTRDWLHQHAFPEAPLITRDHEVKEKNWKLVELAKQFDETLCLIDDSLGKLSDEELSIHTGKLCWYNPLGRTPLNQLVTSFSSWQQLQVFLLA